MHFSQRDVRVLTETHNLKTRDHDAVLEDGIGIVRRLREGDVVMFGRQPTLSHHSMWCKKIRIVPGRVLRYNQAMCTTYNGDFDGDEHNALQPTTVETIVEAKELASLERPWSVPGASLERPWSVPGASWVGPEAD